MVFGPGNDDSKNSLLAAARARKDAYDYVGAVNLLERAIDANPRLARAHWELGLLHYQNTRNYAAAVYHLQKLLALDPKWKQAEDAERIIADAKIELAKQAPFGPDTPQGQRLFSGMTTQIHQLANENKELREKLNQSQVSVQQLTFENHQLREELARGAAAGSAPKPANTASNLITANPVQQEVSKQPARAPATVAKKAPTKSETNYTPPASVSSAARYTVRRGDTAASIARRYGITIRDLGRLNPGLNPSRIKPGDTLRVRQS